MFKKPSYEELETRVKELEKEIDRHNRSKRALRESEEKFRLLVESSPDAIFVQIEERFVYLNKTAVRLFGAGSPDDLIGADVLDRCHPDFRDAVRQRYRSLIHDKEEVPLLERKYLRMDGSPIDVEVSAVPIHYEGNDGALVFVRDISRRIEREKSNEKLRRQLVQAQKMESVGRLAGGVAHDYNNMLSVILGYTEMALEKLDPKDSLHADFLEVLKAGRRSTEITRQLLAFSRRQNIAPKLLDLNETVESMLRMLRRLIGEDIDVYWHPLANLWPVYMDPTQLHQVLVNLCVNSREAIADGGKITIETDNRVFDETYCAVHAGFVPGEFAFLSVSDDGCGMDFDTRQHLFEPFFTTKGVGEGTGLGLATVYGIVKQNNGFINVYSEPDQGTTVKIYLPRYRGKIQRPPASEAEPPTARNHETIMLVEDEPTILKMTATMLEHLGYEVLVSNAPGEAIASAADHSGEIHLLITDVVMPEMNGRELSARLRAFYPDLKILFMSGYTANVIANRGVLDEDVNFIQKPFSKKDLAIKVREALENPC